MPQAASRPAGLDPDGAPPWSLATRFALRAATIYFLLYGIPVVISDFPILSVVGEKYQAIWSPFVQRMGGALLGTEVPPNLPNGSGDQLFSFAEIVCLLLVSAVGSVAWTIASRRRSRDPALAELLRIYLRYLLAFIMLSYGMVKVLKTQFPEPSPIRLVTPLGEMSPMGLLWTFMGHSTAYTVFAGLAEVAGGALLLFRRTTSLGALLLFGVVTNVVILNYSYDVPVKLFSTHLLVMVVLLLAPDVRRLFDVLVRNRASSPVELGAPPVPARWRRGLPIAKGLVVAGMVALVLWSALDIYRTHGDGAERSPLHGVYRVVDAPAEPDSWRRVAISRYALAAVTADRVLRFQLREDPAGGALELADPDDPGRTGRLTWQVRGDELDLAGTVAGRPVRLRLRRIPEDDFLLLGRGFHWVNEVPFNR